MATFAKQTFNSKNYLSYRPTYTRLLYKIIYDYHKLPNDTAVDLGCGPVIILQISNPGHCNGRTPQEIQKGHRNGSLGENALGNSNFTDKKWETVNQL
jgi:hypothetical protein